MENLEGGMNWSNDHDEEPGGPYGSLSKIWTGLEERIGTTEQIHPHNGD